MADDTERRKAAVDRLKNRRAFGQDLVAFVVVNAGLVFVWAVTGGGYFWPAWIIGFWGIGLVMHGWSAFMQRADHRGGDRARDAPGRRRRRLTTGSRSNDDGRGSRRGPCLTRHRPRRGARIDEFRTRDASDQVIPGSDARRMR